MTMAADTSVSPMAAARRGAEHNFPLVAKVLHWSTAALVPVMFCAGILMKEVGHGPWADALMTFHKTAGGALLLLVAVRLTYRILLRLSGRWSRSAGGRAVHRLLYGLLVAIPTARAGRRLRFRGAGHLWRAFAAGDLAAGRRLCR